MRLISQEQADDIKASYPKSFWHSIRTMPGEEEEKRCQEIENYNLWTLSKPFKFIKIKTSDGTEYRVTETCKNTPHGTWSCLEHRRSKGDGWEILYSARHAVVQDEIENILELDRKGKLEDSFFGRSGREKLGRELGEVLCR